MDTDDTRAGGEDGSARPDLRVGDAERSDALEALGRHLEAGRLDIDEFGERSARASLAVRCSDLAPLFADLPAPHPRLPHPPLPEPPPHLPAHPAAGARPAPVASPDEPWRGHPGPPPALRAGVLALALALPVLLVLSASAGAVGGLLVLPLLLVILGGRHGGPGHRHGPGHGPGNRW